MPTIYKHTFTRSQTVIEPKKVRPGAIVQLSYSEGKSTTRPLVLTLANGYYDKKVNTTPGQYVMHGLNLNYLPRRHFQDIRESLERAPILGQTVKFGVEERDNYGRFLEENKRYTKLLLPISGTYDRTYMGLGVAQTRVLMKGVYAQIKPWLKNYDCYRIYKAQYISNIKGIRYKFL